MRLVRVQVITKAQHHFVQGLVDVKAAVAGQGANNDLVQSDDCRFAQFRSCIFPMRHAPLLQPRGKRIAELIFEVPRTAFALELLVRIVQCRHMSHLQVLRVLGLLQPPLLTERRYELGGVKLRAVHIRYHQLEILQRVCEISIHGITDLLLDLRGQRHVLLRVALEELQKAGVVPEGFATEHNVLDVLGIEQAIIAIVAQQLGLQTRLHSHKVTSKPSSR
mmetsp:Transcript_112473/g.357436  ORF Transcript_112473/g.357436 Transcript_112473/m.357436 type:complete len:221 (+) Transcript_112473:488-1150(+)